MKNTPAFPVNEIIERDSNGHRIGSEISSTGLTMRDYFAARAMQSEYALLERLDQFEACAKGAYMMADAMLAARGGDK